MSDEQDCEQCGQWYAGYDCPTCKDNEISALKKRVAELEAERTWKSIDSAPKDGTEIEVARIIDGAINWVSLAVWSAPWNAWISMPDLHRINFSHWRMLSKSKKEDGL